MTRARKFSGKTVEEATAIALAELDAELEDVKIEVISAGRSGILGLGGQPAEIEVSLSGDDGSSFDDDSAVSVDEVEDSTESSADSGDADSSDSEDAAPRGRGRGRGRNRGRSRGRGRGRGRGRDDRDSDDQPQAEASSEAPASDESDVQSDSSDDDRNGRGRNRRDDSQQERSDRSDQSQRSEPIIREKDEEAEQLVSELLDYFLGAMGVVAETYVREDDDEGSMTFEIEGQDAGLLIGRRGETLQALQFLVRMVTNRQLGRKAYVVIDIEDYRERRVQMLRRLARRMAGRVGSSGREDSLEPMSPAERRIVHMALAGHPEVRTESEGEGNQRRVVIFPK
ncbi:MAG: RNA-binding cell elongation regulator Jag/EloR [Dehalococcoidia bacterium]